MGANGCYYPRIHPINMAGSFRNFSENDMLVLCAIISHLGLMYLRVADVGGHNVGWQVESLAYDAQTNLQGRVSACKTPLTFPSFCMMRDGGKSPRGSISPASNG